VERCLSAAQRFVEVGAGAGEVVFLRGGYGIYFAPAAGVDWVELRGDDCGWEGWDGGG
jgi:hypothetical protein